MTLCHRVNLVENLHLLIRNRVVSNCLNREPLVKYVRLCLSGDFRNDRELLARTDVLRSEKTVC